MEQTPSKVGGMKDSEQEEKKGKRAEIAAKKAEREALKHEKELKREAKRQQDEAKRREKEAADKKKQDALEKQKSMMHKFMRGFKPVIREEKPPQCPESRENDAAMVDTTSEKVCAMDKQLAQEFTLPCEEMLSMYISNWRKADPKKYIGWRQRRVPKIDVFKDLKLANDPSSSQSYAGNCGCEHSEDPSSSSQNLDTTAKRRPRMKLLQFDKSFRPAYYGTFSKRSKEIRPRRPLQKDPSLDYEVDSDAEWEEEEPGESLSACDEDEETDKMDIEEESGDEFVVPDGYLSENEGVDVQCEEQDVSAQNRIKIPSNVENIEELYSMLASTTERALKSNTPYIICNFSSSDEPATSKTRESCLQALTIRILAEDVSIRVPKDEVYDEEMTPKVPAKRQRKNGPEVPESMVKDIVHFLQESPQGMKKTVEALSQKFPGVPKSRVETKIREISVYADNRWKVKDEVLDMFQSTTKTKALADIVDPATTVTETTKLFRKRCLPLEDIESLGA